MSGLLTQADKDSAAKLLADAFFDNPAHVYIFPDNNSRHASLQWLMRTNLDGQFAVGVSFGHRAGDKSIAAMAFWHPPGARKAGMVSLLRYGFFAMPFRYGIAAFRRMLFTVKEIEQRRLKALGGRDSWYLNNMVVAPPYRGKGLGARILSQELRDRVEPSGAPASLSTQKPENVQFYKGLGFSVVDDSPVIAGGGNEFPNWIMMYESTP